MENTNDNQTDGAEDRPTPEELLGTSRQQLERQGKEVTGELVYEEEASSHTFFQLYIGIASILLVILGIVALGIWFFSSSGEEPSEPVSITPERFFSISERTEIELLPSTNISEAVEAASDLGQPTGTFTQIYFTHTTEAGKRLAGAGELIRRLGDDGRSIAAYLANDFMYGFYTTDDAQHPYLVLRVIDYERAYGTMLQAEESLVDALRALGFPPVRDFSDIIVQNQDVRVATGGAGRSFFYSFPRGDTLVITTDQAVLREIFSRL
ncbi:MAG: hypothetical protein WD335_00230 [Candidatus Paceibacterota bacterium]